MIKQGFHIGDRDWWVMAYYDIRTGADLEQVRELLLSSGQTPGKTADALSVLERADTLGGVFVAGNYYICGMDIG